MKKISMLLITLSLFIFLLAINASAVNNTLHTANLLEENGTLSITFETKEDDDAYDQIRWYCFTPSSTGSYVFTIKNPFYGDSENDTYICLYDSLSNAKNDNDIVYADMETSKKYIKFYKELKANQKYYVYIEVCACLGIENPHTMTLNVAKEEHKYQSTTTKATLTKNGKTVKKCTACGYVSKTSTIYSPKSIKLSYTTTTYNGKVKTPTVTIKDSKDNTLKKDIDYTVKYASGRKNPGKYIVTVTFKGKYTGTKKLAFSIKPKAPSITDIYSKTKGEAVVKWSNVTGESGFQLYCSTSKNGTYKKVKSYEANKLTGSKTKLKSGKKYYFKVRAYKKADGKIIYSNWSPIKSVKVK